MNLHFLEWTLRRYQLPPLPLFVEDVGWKKDAIYHWNRIGVPEKFRTILQDRIFIQTLSGRVPVSENKNLEDLLKQYKLTKKNRRKFAKGSQKGV